MTLKISELSTKTSYNNLLHVKSELENSVPTIVIQNNKYLVYLINKDSLSQTPIFLDELAEKTSQIAEESKQRRDAFSGVLHPQEWKGIARKITHYYQMAEQIVKQLPKQQLDSNSSHSFQGKAIEAHFEQHHQQVVEKASTLYYENLKYIINDAIEHKRTTINVNPSHLYLDIPKVVLQNPSIKTLMQEKVHAILDKEFKTKKYEMGWNNLLNNQNTISLRDTSNDDRDLGDYLKYLSSNWGKG